MDDVRYAKICDRVSDESFFYGVLTTGIFCRPACRARTPKAENVRYFGSPTQAREAGYRACKRCKPEDTGAAWVVGMCRWLEEEELGLGELAVRVGVSEGHLRRVFKAQVGISPKEYARACRDGRVRARLGQAETVTDAMLGAGYSSSGRFYEDVRRLGMTPTEFRNQGENQMLTYAIGKGWLGVVLVAWSERGICSVLLGEEESGLVADLQARFPKAVGVRAKPGVQGYLQGVLDVMEKPGMQVDLPLDVRGTAFQERVWQELNRVPMGSTVSYGELAIKLGDAKASRAVAGACAANPVAVLVPCHRVVRGDGGLSGYRWGVARKKALLLREGAISGGSELENPAGVVSQE